MRVRDSYEHHKARLLKLKELGLYNFFGDDESSVNYENCGQITQADCGLLAMNGAALSINSYMYFYQIGIAGQFQEPISLEKWAAGNIYSTPVDLSNIDRVPVSIVQPIQDEVCDTTMIEWTYAQMQQEEKYLRFEHGGHLKFGFSRSNENYLERMVETIDYGYVLSFA